MEDLNKTQLVLLNLFVTFVTSIATGVITVALLQEAPETVTQTINRVVERTIEKVVPAEPRVTPALVSQPSQEDLVSRAALSAGPSLIKIYSPESSEASTTPGILLGSGFVVAKEGIVASAGSLFPEGETEFLGMTQSGTQMSLTLATVSDTGVALLKNNSPKSFASSLPLSDLASVSLGKTVLASVLGEEVDSLLLGTVSGFRAATGSTTPVLQTTLVFTSSGVGSPILDTKGVVLGLAESEQRTIPAPVIKEALSRLN